MLSVERNPFTAKNLTLWSYHIASFCQQASFSLLAESYETINHYHYQWKELKNWTLKLLSESST